MWPFLLAFLLFMVCTIYRSSLTLSNTSPFLARSVQLISAPQHRYWKPSVTKRMSYLRSCKCIYGFRSLNHPIDLQLFMASCNPAKLASSATLYPLSWAHGLFLMNSDCLLYRGTFSSNVRMRKWKEGKEKILEALQKFYCSSNWLQW